VDKIFIEDSEDIWHIKKVLRLKKGDKVNISDSMEFEYQCLIQSIEDNCISLSIINKQKFAKEPGLNVTLFQAMPKQSKMETIIQKTVELGIKEIFPVLTKRTVVTPGRDMAKKIERWQRVSAEAVKQCGRGIIPKVNDIINLSEMLQILKEFDFVLFPYEEEKQTSLKGVLRNGKNVTTGKIALIVGPEGGFSEEEAKAVTSAGGISLSLGSTVLRTETAGPAALAMIMYELEMD
jgi:16S rRNA (uracil1498-N3)-methyltransferase